MEFLQANDLLVLDMRARCSDRINEMDASRIGGIAVGNKGELLIGLSGADSLLHGDNRWFGVSIISQMIGCNLEAFRGYKKEEDVIMFALNFVSFILCACRELIGPLYFRLKKWQ